MPETLHQFTLFAGLSNLCCKVYMGLLKAPVHGLFLDPNQVDDQVGAVNQMPDALVVPCIEVLHFDYLQSNFQSGLQNEQHH